MQENIFVEQPFDFSRHSTIGCGGMAKKAFYPSNEEEVRFLLSQPSNGWVAVGCLSNVLPSDKGTDKNVICTKRLTEIASTPDGVYVSAGVTSGALIRYMQENMLSGAEFIVGIPCTLGGLLYMNGGVRGKYIAEIVQSVRIFRDGQTLELPVEECHYAYKHSVFMETEDFILGGTLRLVKAPRKQIDEEIHRWLQLRVNLPKGKSMGCVFKNPDGISAGALIEGAGLKGARVGGAVVSNIHANFILNDQNATAQDIHTLIALIKNKVKAQYGIALEEEIRYL